MQASGGRILVGVDGSPASAAALRWAAAEARLRHMRLHVVHVRDPLAVVPAHYAPTSAGRGVAGRGAAEAAMNALVRDAVGPDGSPPAQLELADGLPAPVLLDRAPGAALLVLGSTRSGAVESAVGKPRAPLGPVARDCLRAAPCPVVVVASQGVPSEAEPVRTGLRRGERTGRR